MSNSPEQTIDRGNQPFQGSMPEGLVEDKEKAIDMAYAGKATREVAKRMEKVNPQVAAELMAKAEKLEQNAGEMYETEFVNTIAREIADMVINVQSGLSPKETVAVRADLSPTVLDRIRHQFYGLFDGGVEARKNARPESVVDIYANERDIYQVDIPGYRLSEEIDKFKVADWAKRYSYYQPRILFIFERLT